MRSHSFAQQTCSRKAHTHGLEELSSKPGPCFSSSQADSGEHIATPDSRPLVTAAAGTLCMYVICPPQWSARTYLQRLAWSHGRDPTRIIYWYLLHTYILTCQRQHRATRLPHRCQSDPDRCTARSENLRGGTLVRKRRESDAVGPFRRAACTRLQRASCTAFRCPLCTNRSSSSPSHINLVSQGIHRTEAPASVKDAYIPPRRKTTQATCNVCMYVCTTASPDSAPTAYMEDRTRAPDDRCLSSLQTRLRR